MELLKRTKIKTRTNILWDGRFKISSANSRAAYLSFGQYILVLSEAEIEKIVQAMHKTGAP